ncbi:hypothetical protein AAFF_G00056250 [Aldrovandia affinis]|uniref:Uncharacterized protein n=1 Tax=Aldrovandia affinis TaxID=143900 RepID=A0AAD7WE93_9TELE|nr:hypothetical protein AAFF_G00056250 [Aldrovandia affinis]
MHGKEDFIPPAPQCGTSAPHSSQKRVATAQPKEGCVSWLREFDPSRGDSPDITLFTVFSSTAEERL